MELYNEFKSSFTKMLGSVFIDFSKEFRDTLCSNLIENIISVYDSNGEKRKFNLGFLVGLNMPDMAGTVDLFYFNAVQKPARYCDYLEDEECIGHHAYSDNFNDDHGELSKKHYDINKYFPMDSDSEDQKLNKHLELRDLTVLSDFQFTYYFRDREHNILFEAKVNAINKLRESKFDFIVRMTYEQGFIDIINTATGKENQNATQ